MRRIGYPAHCDRDGRRSRMRTRAFTSLSDFQLWASEYLLRNPAQSLCGLPADELGTNLGHWARRKGETRTPEFSNAALREPNQIRTVRVGRISEALQVIGESRTCSSAVFAC